MLYLKEIFDLLADGELSGTHLKRGHSGGLDEGEYPKVVGHINLGLLELFKRFNFLTDEIRLHITPGTFNYFLRGDRIASLQNMDSETYLENNNINPFENNIIKVLNVYNAIGKDIPFNDRNAVLKIMSVGYDHLRITPIETKQVLDILFQASYPKIVVDENFIPEEYEMHITDAVIEPLLFYVGARIFKPMGVNSSTQDSDKSTSLNQEYELACQKIETFGLDVQINDNRNNFTQKGFK